MLGKLLFLKRSTLMPEKIIGKTIPEIVKITSERYSDKNALIVNKDDGEISTITYSQMWDKIVKLSSFIQQSSFKKEEHIALLGHNSPEWAITYLAIQAAGCIVVPLDPAQRPQELRRIIRHSESSAIFLERKHLCILSDDTENFFPDLTRFELENIEALISTEKTPKEPRMPYSDECIAVIIYTSGTTGSPKGVMLTHKNIIYDIDAFTRVVPISENEIFLSVLPVHHSFEATTGFLCPLSIGCGIIYARALRAKEILEDIKAGGATIMVGVPILFEKFYNGIRKGVKSKGGIAKSIFGFAFNLTKFCDILLTCSGSSIMKPFRKKAGFGNMWIMVSGGAAIRPEFVKFFNTFGITFLQGYGLTETSPVISVNPIGKIKPASVGPSIPGIQARIGESKSEGIGEIQVKGSIVFKGYYKNERATIESFTEDGWFKTGDLGYIDKDGYIFITGREKNLIVTGGGKNVYPEEIEEKLIQHPIILESLVVGKKTVKGEEPFAIIVPNYDQLDTKYEDWTEEMLENTMKDIIENINGKIAQYKRIKGFKIQQEEFQKTSTKKIKRYLYTFKELEV